MPSKPTIRKVFVYITQGTQLLVFEHPESPEAGIQVPAGTLEADESPEQGVLREAHEETGLSELVLGEFLGIQTRDMSDFDKLEIHERAFYHVRFTGTAPMRWHHLEKYRNDGSMRAIPFELYWVDLQAEIPSLIADHDFYVDKLKEILKI